MSMLVIESLLFFAPLSSLLLSPLGSLCLFGLPRSPAGFLSLPAFRAYFQSRTFACLLTGATSVVLVSGLCGQPSTVYLQLWI